jgi:hypothetical protein
MITMAPCSPAQERALIDAPVDDLNNTFMCNLATEYGTGRDGHAAVDDKSITSNT